MSPTTFSSLVALHGGLGPELTLLEYLSRVLLSLLALGGIAAAALWWSSAAGAVRDAVPSKRGREETEN